MLRANKYAIPPIQFWDSGEIIERRSNLRAELSKSYYANSIWRKDAHST